MDSTAQLLFDYLRDMLYRPECAVLDVQELPEGFRELGMGLRYYAANVSELRAFTQVLGQGNLSAPLPPSGNELAAPLKNLHASLRHLTWQTQQVAQGDYSQRIDFMGEFSEAFNCMTQQLDEQRKALLAEVENGREKALALEQANSLFEALTDKSFQSIVVMDRAGGQQLFANQAAQALLADGEDVAAALRQWLACRACMAADSAAEWETELNLGSGEAARVFHIASYPIAWHSKRAVAYLLSDVSVERQMVRALENAAYQDALTGLFSRFYGMQVLRDWLADGRSFVLCFADIDNLKYVNDSFGHSEGDEYIVGAAALLRNFSPGCVTCRVGGDEFMVLAEGMNERKSKTRMEALRESFALAGAEKLPRYRRSFSYGVVAVSAGSARSSSELLAEADKRMYRYKRAHKACEKPRKD